MHQCIIKHHSLLLQTQNLSVQAYTQPNSYNLFLSYQHEGMAITSITAMEQLISSPGCPPIHKAVTMAGVIRFVIVRCNDVPPLLLANMPPQRVTFPTQKPSTVMRLLPSRLTWQTFITNSLLPIHSKK